jgi:hypothetical protein
MELTNDNIRTLMTVGGAIVMLAGVIYSMRASIRVLESRADTGESLLQKATAALEQQSQSQIENTIAVRELRAMIAETSRSGSEAIDRLGKSIDRLDEKLDEIHESHDERLRMLEAATARAEARGDKRQ